MSAHLHIIANHSMRFKGLSLDEIGQQTIQVLNAQKLLCKAFIQKDYFKGPQTYPLPPLEWSYVISKSLHYGGLDESDYLQIKSNWGIDLIMEEGYVVLQPHICKTKHYHWFHDTKNLMDPAEQYIYQNEWSKVLISIAEALGGNTVYLLADMDYDHNYKSTDSFAEIEQTLLEKCGPAKTSYDQMKYDPDEDEIPTPYLKVTKESVNWNLKYILENIQ